MNWKNAVRLIIFTGIVSWPAYEYYQYQQARKELASSVALRQSVSDKLAATRVKYAQAPVRNEAPVQ